MISQPQSGASSARWIALAGVWLVYMAFGATAASLAPLLPEIRADFGTDNAMFGLILGVWPLVYIAAAIPAGILLDRVGVSVGLLCASLIIGISAALRGWADGPYEMLFAVGVFGIGGPLISIGAPKLIASLFSGSQRALAMGIYTTGPSLGAIATLSLTNKWLIPLLGSWREVMFFHAGVAILCGLIWFSFQRFAALPKLMSKPEPFDLGALKAIISHKQVLMILAMAIGIFYINHALSNWLPTLLQEKGMNATKAGDWASIPTIVGLISAILIPRLIAAHHRLFVLILLAAIACISSLLLASSPGVALAIGLFLSGIIRGSMNTLAILILMELPAIPKNRIGLAGGIYFSAAEIGGVLGPLSFGLLQNQTQNFNASIISLAVISVGLIGVGIALERSNITAAKKI